MDSIQLIGILDEVTIPVLFGDGRHFRHGCDERALWIQVVFYESFQGKEQRCRKWRISKHATRSEVVGTCFLACKQAMEHELREQFTYGGVQIYSPHYDVDRLAAFCSITRFDERENHQP